MNDDKLLDWAEFVATKFEANHTGWVYSRDTGDLEHIRYKHDHTGYDHWSRRLKRGLFTGPNPFKSMGIKSEWRGLGDWFMERWSWFLVNIRKDTNLPDGMVNGIITHWEEDGEYITLFQPRVGMKVLEFVRANPDNEYAKAIVAEMQAVKEMSWPSKEGVEA